MSSRMCDSLKGPDTYDFPASIRQVPQDGVLLSPKKKSRRRGPRLTGVSKQRRMANARERKRVNVLNRNIENLRHHIPIPPQEKEPSRTEVIWMAADYIAELTKMLETPDELSETITGRSDFFDWNSLMDIDDKQILCIDGENKFCFIT